MENTEFKIDQANVEQQKAFDLIENTNTSVFITGKAGTGKTTFVKGIQQLIKKNFLVLAPTGIAAVNVGGQTIHSFFGLPFTAIEPKTNLEVSLLKRDVLEHVDTIIIDEASMVRCDWVDAIDRFLCQLTHSHMPFGGKQMLFVGDLFQLPPVVKKGSADDEMLCNMYGGGMPYFYKANVMKRMNLPKIEFQIVYRQEDAAFLNVLDRMRIGENTEADMALLNEHVSSDNAVGDYAVTLTAYNSCADNINDIKLEDIDANEFVYNGVVDGNFRVQDSPVPLTLRLKVGAQVIFCRNDFARGYVNGTIAIVTKLGDDEIRVRLENGIEIDVPRMVWESRESVYNKKTKELETSVIGTFTQYPLKLAWAITIHKSQGMTLSRMHLDLTRGTFAPGQAYVAISRMRSLDGLTLSNKIKTYHIVQNTEIKAFANSFNDIPMIDEELSFGRMLYKHLNNKDYDNAAKLCLHFAIEKMKAGDYRNAALIAKRMYDVLLDDHCLMGTTKDIALLKDCSMTCNFLNAMVCLYGKRFEEAVGFADMVLDRRQCPEAMFIKGTALFELKRYDDADTMAQLIRDTLNKSDNKMAIDKKQYLFEAKINQQLGRIDIDTCTRLLMLCPEYLPAYTMLRKDALAAKISIKIEDGEENALITAFNNSSITEKDFKKMLSKAKTDSAEFITFARSARNIETRH